jgi:hypothetical protein
MKNFFGKIAICLSLISLALCAVQDVEDIVFRLGTVSFRGSLTTPYELITCEIDWPVHFDTILKVDTADKMLHLDYPDAIPYKEHFEKFVQQTQEFSKCQLNSLIKYSKDNSRLHLNVNPSWNNGFFVENVNLLTKDNGDWTVQVKIEEYYDKRQIMVLYLDFEKIRPKEEIDILVAWLKTLNARN